MIEFDGYIMGSAEKYFFKKIKRLSLKLIYGSLLLPLPGVIILSLQYNFWVLLGVYSSMFITAPLCFCFPKSKKEKKAIKPKRIFTEDEYIIAVTDKCEDIKRISDVKEVYDFGEFYELVFPFGKVSEKFICQKDLLTKGSLKEFEALFECPIKRKRQSGDGSLIDG